MGDIGIYNELASILVANAPDESRIIKFRFLVESDSSEMEGGFFRSYFDYELPSGEEMWFFINEVDTRARLTDLSLELRKYMAESGHGKWIEFIFCIDIKAEKFSADFSY